MKSCEGHLDNLGHEKVVGYDKPKSNDTERPNVSAKHAKHSRENSGNDNLGSDVDRFSGTRQMPTAYTQNYNSDTRRYPNTDYRNPGQAPYAQQSGAYSTQDNGYVYPDGSSYGRRPQPQQNGYAQQPLPSADGSAFFNQSNSSVAIPGKKKKKGKRILITLLVIIALLCAAVAAYYFALGNALRLDDGVGDSLTSVSAGEPYYTLVLGSDSREGAGTSDDDSESGDNQRSDVMILVRVDEANKKLTMVSIPRDTQWVDPSGTRCKINEAYNQGGANYSIKAVEDLTGVKISHYVEIQFSNLEQIVNKLGGVTVDVPVELSYEDALTNEWITIPSGEQTLDGQQAQIFARARHEYGDNQEQHRQSSVRQLATAILEKSLDRPLYELPTTVLDLAQNVSTDLNPAQLSMLAAGFSGGDMTVYSCNGPSEGDFMEAYGGTWYCYENPEGWARLMSVVDAGEDPSGVDVESGAIRE